MASHSRLPSIVLAAVLAAACASAGVPPTAVPTPDATLPNSGAIDGSSQACKTALTHLGAFTQRMAGDIELVRSLVVAKAFDYTKMGESIRRMAATSSAYPQLDLTVGACPPAADIAARVASLIDRVTPVIDKALIASSAQSQRDVAVALVNLLPDVLALSKDGKSLADDLGFEVALATVAAGAEKPIGSLAPLPTAMPFTPVTAPPLSDGLVSRPNVSVKIAGVTTVYFNISGNTLATLETSWLNRAVKSCGKIDYNWYSGDRRPMSCAKMKWSVWKIPQMYNPDTGSCRIGDPTLKAAYSIPMPKWTSPKRVPASLAAWYNAEIARTKSHEAKHFAIDKKWVPILVKRLRGQPCSSGQRTINRWGAQLNAAQEAFDKSDY